MTPEKFMFERSFDTDQPAVAQVEVEEVIKEEEPEIELPTFSEQDMEAAKKEGFDQGREEALKESATAIENQIVDTTKSIGEKLDSLIVGQLIANKDIFTDAIKVSHAVTKKMFPAINIEQGLPEIENVIRHILVQVLEEPRVVIHVHPTIVDTLNERISQISTETHFEGRLHVTGSDSVTEGDCTIEWSNGGADRNLENLLTEADAIIEANLASLEGGYVPSPEAFDLDTPDTEPAPPADSDESVVSSAPTDGVAKEELAENSQQENAPHEPQTPPIGDNSTKGPETETSSTVSDPQTDQAQNSATKPSIPPDLADPQTADPAVAVDGSETDPEKNSETNSSEGV